jgi:hypothetical protein
MNIQNILRGNRWSHATLRVFSETLSHEDIGAMLGLKASRTYARGEPVSNRVTSRKRREWVWLFESQLPTSLDLDEHLKWLLDVIEAKLPVLKTLSANCRIDLFCGFGSESGQGGITLDSVILKRIANLGVNLSVDLYPSGSDKTKGDLTSGEGYGDRRN